jgi:hypothetical protein
MSEEPSGLHAALKHPLDLASGDALLTGAHKMDDLKPEMQRKVAGLENGAHADGKGLAALVALVEALASSFASKLLDALAVSIAAMMANWPIRPKARLNISESFVFVLEVWGVKNRVSHSGLSYGYKSTLWGLVCQV